MKDFLQYVIGELKSKRLTKNEAIELIKQYKKRTALKKQVLLILMHLFPKQTETLAAYRAIYRRC
jgi:hypothetical protein